ncbi:Hsp20/alpha crystallin family protein [Cupriavidus basilensis]|uniref:Hsp20/alpha crystallin family protein n=1 Tax=Cupriavidus basilensis TaxID=68895 RepID=UPI0023E8CA4D|nr:Hsp20/alpha crystallin family protein [Cupriavidus basilensis]MDF3887279.1 Hsp20/alpha crystallin family protein [Cupriavidus basilensis]
MRGGSGHERNTAVTKQADTGSTEAALIPPVNVYEDAAGITLYADLPGVPKDKLVVQVEGDILTIKGEVVLAQPDDMEASYTEVSLPRYRRVLTLSKELDAEKVVAEFNHGVLKLRIPKAEHAQPSRIEVKVA